MESYISLLTGFIGALIGAGSSIIAVVIQSRIQDRREQMKLAADMAWQDYKNRIEVAKEMGGEFKMPPVAIFIHYHLQMMKVFSQNNFDEKDIERVGTENDKLRKVLGLDNDTEKSSTT